jgi:hypothetical protein
LRPGSFRCIQGLLGAGRWENRKSLAIIIARNTRRQFEKASPPAIRLCDRS